MLVQWLRLHASNAGGMGLIPSEGIKIPQAMWHSQSEKKKKKRISVVQSASISTDVALMDAEG